MTQLCVQACLLYYPVLPQPVAYRRMTASRQWQNDHPREQSHRHSVCFQGQTRQKMSGSLNRCTSLHLQHHQHHHDSNHQHQHPPLPSGHALLPTLLLMEKQDDEPAPPRIVPRPKRLDEQWFHHHHHHRHHRRLPPPAAAIAPSVPP